MTQLPHQSRSTIHLNNNATPLQKQRQQQQQQQQQIVVIIIIVGQHQIISAAVEPLKKFCLTCLLLEH